MGVDIHITITELNKDTGKYEPVWLYRKNKNGDFVRVNVFDGRNSDLFDILSSSSFLKHGITHSLYSDNLAAEIRECEEAIGYYGFSETTLADMERYVSNVPEVPDYDEDWGEQGEHPVYKENPVALLIDLIKSYIEFAGSYVIWHGVYSDIRIVYWFDH